MHTHHHDFKPSESSNEHSSFWSNEDHFWSVLGVILLIILVGQAIKSIVN